MSECGSRLHVPIKIREQRALYDDDLNAKCDSHKNSAQIASFQSLGL